MLENDNQQATADYSKQMQLIKSILPFSMRDGFTNSESEALDKLMSEVADFKATLKVDATATAKPYIKVLANTEISPSVVSMVKESPSLKRDVSDFQEIINGLDKLKFSEEEILHLLITLDRPTLLSIKIVWDPIKLLTADISEIMTKERLSLPEAINAVLNRARDRYKQGIDQHHFRIFLSPEAKIQLYIHARVGLVMGKQVYDHNNDDNSMTRKLAQFHVEHNNKLFLALDYALKDLKFPVAETYALLLANDNMTAITSLQSKVSLVQTYVKEIQAAMTGPNNLSFEQAQAALFNETSSLSEQDFSKFLSPALKAQLTPAKPTISSTAAAIQSFKHVMPEQVKPTVTESAPVQIVPMLSLHPVPTQTKLISPSNLRLLSVVGATLGGCALLVVICGRPLKNMCNSIHRKFTTKPKTEDSLPSPAACQKVPDSLFHRH